jgi:DNA-binding MarR family transcriptional regulator
MGSQAFSPVAVGVREALDAVRHLVRALRMGHSEARRHTGLSAAQLFVLHALGAQGGLALRELAAVTATDESSVSVVVARLVERGLVAAHKSDRDRRRLALHVTARGRAVLRRSPERLVQHGLVGALEGLPARDRRTLARLLRRVVELSGDPRSAPGMLFEEPHPATRRTHAGRRPSAARRVHD